MLGLPPVTAAPAGLVDAPLTPSDAADATRVLDTRLRQSRAVDHVFVFCGRPAAGCSGDGRASGVAPRRAGEVA